MLFTCIGLTSTLLRFVRPSTHAQPSSLAETWEKFARLSELWVVYDRHKTNICTSAEFIVLTTAVGLGECSPSFGQLFSKVKSVDGSERSNRETTEKRMPFDRLFRGLQVINYPKMTQLPVINYKKVPELVSAQEFRGNSAEEDLLPVITEKLKVRTGWVHLMIVVVVVVDEAGRGKQAVLCAQTGDSPDRPPTYPILP